MAQFLFTVSRPTGPDQSIKSTYESESAAWKSARNLITNSTVTQVDIEVAYKSTANRPFARYTLTKWVEPLPKL